MCCYQTFFYFFIYFPRTVRSGLIDSKLWACCVYIFYWTNLFFILIFACVLVFTRWSLQRLGEERCERRESRQTLVLGECYQNLTRLQGWLAFWGWLLRWNWRRNLWSRIEMHWMGRFRPGSSENRWKEILNFLEKVIFFMKHEFLADFLKNKGLTKTTIITHL